ncbi:MAG: DUF2290 domain-containing protein [bacterium]
MNPSSINTDINKLCCELIRANMGIDYNPSYFDSKEQLIHLKAKANLYEIISIPTLIERFKAFLEKKYFNCVLFDGSLIQFFYMFDSQNRITNHRLCYIPCPVEITADEIEEYSLVGIINIIKDDQVELYSRLKNSSPIRFDFDVKNSSTCHPASHLTIISDHCRIPVCSPMDPCGFVRFILENFYDIKYLEEIGIDIKIIKTLCSKNYNLFEKTIEDNHKKILHLNCNVV